MMLRVVGNPNPTALPMGILPNTMIKGYILVRLAARATYAPPVLAFQRLQVLGSSRAQARTTVGREFPLSALSIAERGPSPAIAHVSCTLSKIR
jgi:hypothetical protein